MRAKYAIVLGLCIAVAPIMGGLQRAVAQPAQHFGGYGGSKNNPKWCGDHRVVGIHGYVGARTDGTTVVTQLGFTCANGAHEIGTFGPPNGMYFDIRCNPGDAAVGIGGRSGTYLDAIGLTCRDPQGIEYVAPVTTGPFFAVAGVGGGGAFKSASCGNTPLVGLAIWSGTNIDGVEPICNPAQPPEHFGGNGGMSHGPRRCPDRIIGIHGYVGARADGTTVVTQLGFTCANGEHELGTFGPPNGTYFDIRCNPGDAAFGLGGRSGTYLDAIGLTCRDRRGNEYVAPVTTGPFFGVAGVAGGSAFKSTSCPNTLIGLTIWSGANIDGVDSLCMEPPPPAPSVTLTASPYDGYNCLGTEDTLSWTTANCGAGCDVTLTGHGYGYASNYNVTLPHLPTKGSYSVKPGDQINFTITASSSAGSGSASKNLTIAPPNVCPGGNKPPALSPFYFAVKASNPLVQQCTWIAVQFDTEAHAEAQVKATYGPDYTVTSITEDDYNHQRKCP